jgi:glucan endo-1,3-alpha-glucosidase
LWLVSRFDAATGLNSNFKLFFSFDMAASTCATVDDSVFLRKKITDFSSSPSMLKIDGKVFASTFAGESW